MSMNDPVADMLTRIRNANRNRAQIVAMPSSRMKEGIAAALQREGFINDFEVAQAQTDSPHKTLRLSLRYGPDGERIIQFLDRASKPGRRIYSGVTTLPRVLGGMGCAILSTNRGILSDRECRKERVGGEILCLVG